MRWSHLHGDMQGSHDWTRRGIRSLHLGAASKTLERNSLSGKYHLPHRSVRNGDQPAHIGETLLLRQRAIPREVVWH